MFRSRRSIYTIVLVVVVGYSLYGGVVIGASALHDSLVDTGDVPSEDDSLAAQFVSDFDADEFQFAAVDVGLNYTYVEEDGAHQGIQVNTNAGVFVADYDGDGRPDALAIGGERPVLFENVGGEFEPSGALPQIEADVRGAHWIDHNVNGQSDLILFLEDAPPILLENDDGEFEPRPDVFDEPLAVPFGATSADYDGDGCPDLFVYQNGHWGERLAAGYHNFSIPINADNGNPDYLYRGTCDGFERVEDAGIEGDRWTLAASFVDLTGNGLPDIHTANDINNDVVYLNNGDGTFEQIALPERTNRQAMSSEVADVTGNGYLDIFVTNVYYPEWAADKMTPEHALKARGNNLLTNLGDGTFVDRADHFGVNAGGFGWAAVIADYDNDGHQDLVHATRHIPFEQRDLIFSQKEVEELRSHPFYHYPSVWSGSKAPRFDRVDAEASGFLTMDGRGVARFDFNGDGRLDLVFATTDEFKVYENRMERGNAIQVRVLGADGTQVSAHGASVTVNASGYEQTRHVHSETGFLSQGSQVAHVGIANETRADVTVEWPDGTTRIFEGVTAGQRLVVTPDGIERTIEQSPSG